MSGFIVACVMLISFQLTYDMMDNIKYLPVLLK